MQTEPSYAGDWDADYSGYYGEEDGSLPEVCGPEEAEADAIRGFQSFVFCLVFLLGVAGNILVITAFELYRRRCLRSMTDVFLVHLAAADLLLLLTLPLQSVDTHLGWVLPEPLCKAMRGGHALNTYSGLLLLACISVDRYVLVAWPQEVLRLRGRLLAAGKLASLAVWLSAVLLSVPEVRYSGVSLEAGGAAHCVVKEQATVKRVTSVALIATFGLSSVVMVTCYSCVGRRLWAGAGERRRGCRRQRRTLKLMVALVVVFLLFQLPHAVVLWHKMAAVAFCGVVLEYVTCTLAYSRCCLNPILYALMGSRFRDDLRKMAALCRRHRLGKPRGLAVQSANSCSTSFPSSPSHTSFPPPPPPVGTGQWTHRNAEDHPALSC